MSRAGFRCCFNTLDPDLYHCISSLDWKTHPQGMNKYITVL